MIDGVDQFELNDTFSVESLKEVHVGECAIVWRFLLIRDAVRTHHPMVLTGRGLDGGIIERTLRTIDHLEACRVQRKCSVWTELTSPSLMVAMSVDCRSECQVKSLQ